MKQTLTTPRFQNEQEEADWYDSHQDDLLAQFQQAAREGTLRRGTLAKRGLTPQAEAEALLPGKH